MQGEAKDDIRGDVATGTRWRGVLSAGLLGFCLNDTYNTN